MLKWGNAFGLTMDGVGSMNKKNGGTPAIRRLTNNVKKGKLSFVILF